MKQELIKKANELYTYLCKNAVGEEAKVPAKRILLDYSFTEERRKLFPNRQAIEEAVKYLREHSNRKIGSDSNGYWLMCTNDTKNGLQYLINQAISKLETAIKSGVDPRVFYKALNQIAPQCNDTADNQVSLENNVEVKRYSDDLDKINTDLFYLDMKEHWDCEDSNRWSEIAQKRKDLISSELEVINNGK